MFVIFGTPSIWERWDAFKASEGQRDCRRGMVNDMSGINFRSVHT
jgi:hypothetical protein